VIRALILSLSLAAGVAAAQVAVPPLTGRVVDLTGTLSGAVVARIENKLASFERSKGSQLAVLIVPTTEPEDIEQFGIRVLDQWKLGRKGVDDSAILIVAKNDRRLRIEVGYGLEGALNDATANRIIEEIITPQFKQGDYDAGVEAGVDRMISVASGEPLPPPDRKWEHTRGLGNLLPLFLIAVVVASGLLRQLFGRLFGSLATGGLAGVIAFLLSHVWLGRGLGGWVGWGGFRRRRRGRRLQWRRWWWRRRRGLGRVVMKAARLLRHLAEPHWRTRLRFPTAALDAIEQAVGRAERSHAGQIRFMIETALPPLHIFHDVSARARALELFSVMRVWDTEHNNGVLIYVQLADRSVEIVADRGIAARVGADEWQGVCRLMEEHFRAGGFQSGAVAGVDAVGALLSRHFPPAAGLTFAGNELPDRPTLL
jgi:uncharacterized protein